jgi:hypothetical protein
MTRKIISQATDDELRAFADTIGVVLAPQTKKRDTIIDRIKVSWDKDYIEVGDSLADLAPTGIKNVLVVENEKLEEDGEKKVYIELQTSDAPGGDQPQFVQVNGRSILIPRGQRVQVAKKFVEALKNAVTEVYEPLRDGGVAVEPRKVARFPMAIFNSPAD